MGSRTRIWAFAHVLPGARIGSDCNICDHVFIENDVVIGDRVTIKCGVQVWDAVTLGDDVFVGPNATFTNDRFPRSKNHIDKYPRTLVRQGASVGANATLLPGVTIGRGAMVGAGAVVVADVPPRTIVVGNPAYIKGYVDAELAPAASQSAEPGGGPAGVSVRGVTVHSLPLFADLRGSLMVGERPNDLPFEPHRFFTVFNVPSRNVRGEHAHRKLHEFLVCVAGECSLIVDDGSSRAEIQLVAPSVGVHIQPMVWSVQYKYSRDAVLLVLADRGYEPEDYVRDYDDFLSLVREQRQ